MKNTLPDPAENFDPLIKDISRINKHLKLAYTAAVKAMNRIRDENCRKKYDCSSLMLTLDGLTGPDIANTLIIQAERFINSIGYEFCLVKKNCLVSRDLPEVALLYYHRSLKSLILIDVRTGDYSDADHETMKKYIAHAGRHWTKINENPPVGLTLRISPNQYSARYFTDCLPSTMAVKDYRDSLPAIDWLEEQLERWSEIINDQQPDRWGQSLKSFWPDIEQELLLARLYKAFAENE